MCGAHPSIHSSSADTGAGTIQYVGVQTIKKDIHNLHRLPAAASLLSAKKLRCEEESFESTAETIDGMQ